MSKTFKFDIKTYFINTYFTFPEYSIDFMDGNLYIMQEKILDITNIDWNIISEMKSNTYLVFLNSLEFLNKIFYQNLELYNQNNYEIIKKIIFSYIQYKKEIKYQWYDHSMGKRTQMLSLFYFIYKNKLSNYEKEILIKRLNLEKKQLLNEKLYTKHGNHGVFQDIGLLSVSYVTDDILNFNTALKRLKSHFTSSFSPNGVHLENSTGYQSALLKMFETIYLCIDRNFEELIVLEKVKKLVSFEAKVITRGDTRYIEKKLINEKQIIEKIEDGIVLFNNGLISSVFISGCSNYIHKHADNLSFNLNVMGIEFFIDPGMFKYDYSNSVSEFLIRPESHNTIYEKLVNPLWIDPAYEENVYMNKTGLEHSYLGTSYQFVNSVFTRNIQYEKNTVIIHDLVKSENEKEIIVNFHLHPEVILNKLSETNYMLERSNHKLFISSDNPLLIIEDSQNHISKIVVNNEVLSTKRLIIEAKTKMFKNRVFISTSSVENVDKSDYVFQKIQTRKSIKDKLFFQSHIECRKNRIITTINSNKTHHYTIRGYLYKNGFNLCFKECRDKELMIFEDLEIGKYYIVYRVYNENLDDMVAYGYSDAVQISKNILE